MAWSYGNQEQLSIKWALAASWVAGFRGRRLVSAVALWSAESGLHPGAWHENMRDDGTVSSTDRGIAQINDRWHPTLVGDNETRTGPAYEVLPNLRYARGISNRGRNFGPWAAYGTPRYFAAYATVLAVWALGTWKGRIPKVEQRFAEPRIV